MRKLSAGMDTNIFEFIRSCVRQRRIYWTYHVNMRLKGRFIPRETILRSVNSYEIIEEYPKDKYLPSYLVYAEYEKDIIHIHIAVNVKNKNIIIITAYRPSMDKWEKDFKTRRTR